MKAWIYRRAEQVRQCRDEAPWYVAWIDSYGKQRSKSCGAGQAGKIAAAILKAEIEKTKLFEILSDPSCRKKHRLPALSSEQMERFSAAQVVYFIEACGLERVKIGTTSDLSRRFRIIQANSPVNLRVLAAIKGDSSLENMFHLRFEPVRLHGEWFQLTNDLLAFIANIKESDCTEKCSPPDFIPPSNPDEPSRQILR